MGDLPRWVLLKRELARAVKTTYVVEITDFANGNSKNKIPTFRNVRVKGVRDTSKKPLFSADIKGQGPSSIRTPGREQPRCLAASISYPEQENIYTALRYQQQRIASYNV
jgi:hypothetical protein